ncbi:zinc-finger of the MIZ type in Nse subunit-domain-containing protein [Xylariales sp. PMI_506]|nr:zinc-finger of the MIZ type in Nse subunit-domain-containing protein [Xylariales sp. PMI_506]
MSSRRLLSNSHRSRGGPSDSNATSPSHRRPVKRARDAAELPEYEPPSCPLNTASRNALAELSNNATTRKYSDQLAQSLKLLSKTVAELNDRYVERRESLQGLQEKRCEKGGGSGSSGDKSEQERSLEEAVAQLAESVPALTKRSEEAVREVIDWSVELQDRRSALEEARRLVEEESVRAGDEARLRSGRPRRRQSARRKGRNGGEEEDENGEGLSTAAAKDENDATMDEDEDDEPVEITGPRAFLAQAREKLAADYRGKTQYQRYGLNNDYIQFKRMWHDAAHGRDDKPLPDATRWFDGAGEDEDDDLVVENEIVDLRCPLTLVTMSEPFTSSKCKHTFEKAAITEYLRSKPGRKATCPQTGCNKEVSLKDFALDEVFLRRIKRAQEKRERNRDEDDEEEGEEDEDETVDQSMLITSTRNIKEERSQRSRRQRVEDIDDDDDNIDDADEDEEMADDD